MTRDEWLLARRQGISASDVAGILGLSPWSSAFAVYADKVGLTEERAATDQMVFGKEIEELIAQKWAKKENKPIVWKDELVVGPESWILATPDAEVLVPTYETPTEGLEVKTMGYKTEEWGEPYTDQVPDRVLTQVQWQMLATGWGSVNIAAFYTGPRKLESFKVYGDKELQASMRERCRDFWVNRVLTRTPPDVDWSEEASSYLKARFPTAKEEPREATEQESDLVIRYAKVSAAFRLFEREKKTLANLLKEKIGNAKAIIGDGFKMSWYDVAGSTYTVTRQPGRVLKGSGPAYKKAGDGE